MCELPSSNQLQFIFRTYNEKNEKRQEGERSVKLRGNFFTKAIF